MRCATAQSVADATNPFNADLIKDLPGPLHMARAFQYVKIYIIQIQNDSAVDSIAESASLPRSRRSKSFTRPSAQEMQHEH
jgi:hypothetical protein